MNFTKNAFSQSVFELETLCKDLNNEQQYANTMAHFRAPPMHFRSRDVINVIFGKTAITPFVKRKASNKNKTYPGRHIGSAQY